MSDANAAQLLDKLEQEFESSAAGGKPFALSAESAIAKMSLQLANVPDNEFLVQLCKAAAKTLKTDFMMVGRLNRFSNIMRSVFQVCDGEPAPNFTYSLDGTPCAHALDDHCCVYTQGVADLFPRDVFLQDHNIEGYVGVSLKNASGEPVGLLAGLTREPISNDAVMRATFEHFSLRAVYALESAEQLERLDWAVNKARDGVWDWDIVTGGVVVSPKIQKLLGYRKGRGPYDLEHLERAIHPDDLAAHKDALRQHVEGKGPYNVRFRLKLEDGNYRWFHSRAEGMRNEDGRAVRIVGVLSDVHEIMAARSQGQL